MNRRTFFKSFFLLIVTFFFFSCETTKSNTEFLRLEDTLPKPPLLTELPAIEYSGAGIKYEVESMLLHNFLVYQDLDASGKYAARLLDESSTAKVKVKFPAGTYECLVMEKAPSAKKSAFYVLIDDTAHRVYPSNPPLGTWELTTRTPVFFTVDEPSTVLVTIQANSESQPGDTGMGLDYIQFVKKR